MLASTDARCRPPVSAFATDDNCRKASSPRRLRAQRLSQWQEVLWCLITLRASLWTNLSLPYSAFLHFFLSTSFLFFFHQSPALFLNVPLPRLLLFLTLYPCFLCTLPQEEWLASQRDADADEALQVSLCLEELRKPRNPIESPSVRLGPFAASDANPFKVGRCYGKPMGRESHPATMEHWTRREIRGAVTLVYWPTISRESSGCRADSSDRTAAGNREGKRQKLNKKPYLLTFG